MVKTYKTNMDLEKILYQNKVSDFDYIDCFEGCLLDSLFVATKRGYMAILETFVNCWSSCYTIHFSESENEIYSIWEKYTGVE